MKTAAELRQLVTRIDHRSYPAYKDTKGMYQFPGYLLSIDHVQGDPFASPSKVSIHVEGKAAAFPSDLYCGKDQRIALQDALTRRFARQAEAVSFRAKGSGHSGLISISRCGQEVLERTACALDPEHGDLLLRLEVGFPANGRTINARELEKIDIFTGVKTMPFDEAKAAGHIELMGEETDNAFMENVMAMVNDRECVAKVADTFHVVYTPFHGCGWKLVPQALRDLGVKHLHCVPEQMVLDGSFPTVVSPNPENPEGFYLAIALADRVGANFIIGTDPDSDRVGILVRNKGGRFVPVSGNQTGVLLADYLLGAMARSGKLPKNAVLLKTIVTTEMARRVAEAHGVKCYDTFTGFKFMAEKKQQLESQGLGKVVFSYEESYGYMLGDYVRDKDAVTASLLLTEMAAWYQSQGMTLFDALQALYEKYGYYGEKTHNLVMPGLDGLEKMAALMKNLRDVPPTEIAGVAVTARTDYKDGTITDCTTGQVTASELKGSNVLRYTLADGTVILVRPSGTEPKIKVYILTLGKDAEERDTNIEKYSQWALALQN